VSADSLEAAAQLFVNPASYTDETTLNAGLTLLREQAAVIRVEHPKYRPFWAVTDTLTSSTYFGITHCG